MKIFTSQLFVLVLFYCCTVSLGWRSWNRRKRTTASPPPPTSRPNILPRRNPEGPLQVNRGQLTFDAEGNDNPESIFFSRRPHVPSSASGITIGRGYDLKLRKQADVYRDFLNIGIPETIARALAGGAGLQGQAARNYLGNNNLQNYIITHNQQKELFYIAYDAIAADARRLATKPDVVAMFGNTDWDRLNSAIKEVVVDLRYRGDYTPTTRRKIQRAVAANNLILFTQLMSDENYWLNVIGVPRDRFLRRRNALINAG